MTSIYNVKSITLNGNQVTRFAVHYNPYNKTKDKTLISQQALEEAISAKDVPCDYTFSKQHLLNTTYGNITIEKKNTEYYDLTYNLHVEVSGDEFSYSTDTLATVSTSIVYMASNAKLFDENKILTIDNFKDVEFEKSGETITYKSVTGDTLYFGKNFFTATSDDGTTTELKYFTSYTQGLIYSKGRKIENGKFVNFDDDDFIGRLGDYDEYYTLKKDTEFVIINNYTGDYTNIEIMFEKNISDWTFNTVKAKKVYEYEVNSNDIIKDLYIDDSVFLKLNFETVATEQSIEIQDVYYNGNLSNGSIKIGDANLHTNTNAGNLYLLKFGILYGSNVKPNIECNILYLSSTFFNNTNLDEISTSNYGMFGDFSDNTVTKINKIVLDTSQLYTAKTTTEEISTLIKTILKLNASIELELTE